jgi:hypothetical protein
MSEKEEKKESVIWNLFSFLLVQKKPKKKQTPEEKELQKHYKHVEPKHVKKEEVSTFI